MTKYIALFLLLLPSAVFAGVEVTYIMCNPSGSDADGEYIKVKNTGSTDIDLTGWKFNDGSNHNLNTPPKNGGTGDMVLVPTEVAMFANKADKVSGESTIIDTVMALSNSGDTVKLLDANGVEMASVTYSKSDVVEGGSCIVGGGDSGTGGADNSNSNSTVVNEVTTYKTVVIEPPQDIHIRKIEDKTGLLGGIVYVQPEVYDATGKVPDVSCYTTFGDGTTTSKCDAGHIYRYAGEYMIKVVVSKGTLRDETVFDVSIVEPQLWLTVSEDNKYVELHNASDMSVELNGWLVQAGYRRFDIPKHTMVPAHTSMKISGESMHIDIARVGGKAELHNVFNKIVQARPLVEVIDVAEEDERPIEVETPQGVVQVQKPEVSLKPPTLVSSRIIGTDITEVPTRVDTTLQLTEVAPIPLPSEAVVEPIAQVASVGILPDNVTPWLLGMLGLLALAVLPLIFGNVTDGGHQDLVGEDDLSDKFTIKEIR